MGNIPKIDESSIESDNFKGFMNIISTFIENLSYNRAGVKHNLEEEYSNTYNSLLKFDIKGVNNIENLDKFLIDVSNLTRIFSESLKGYERNGILNEGLNNEVDYLTICLETTYDRLIEELKLKNLLSDAYISTKDNMRNFRDNLIELNISLHKELQKRLKERKTYSNIDDPIIPNLLQFLISKIRWNLSNNHSTTNNIKK